MWSRWRSLSCGESLSGSVATITIKHYPIVIMRIWQLLCGSVLVLNMAGCANKTASVENSTVAPKATVASTSSTGTAPGFTALQGTIGSTKKAIEAGKLDVAKTEFAKFENSWKTVEDGVKSKSGETYRAIEDGVKSVESGIGSKQGKAALLASLQKLSQSIEKASK
jgi:soluble cytochrome b562